MDRLSDIIAGCKSNDRKCQQELYYHFYPAMFSLCRKFFRDEHEIQTALNNGMMKVFKNISQYDSSKGDVFNWIYTVVRNTCLTLLRNRKPDTTIELKEDMESIHQYDPFQTAEWEEVFHALDKLPPATRVVCSLFYLENFSIKEISTDMNLKEGTVKWHLNESRNRLKDVFTKNQNK